MFIGCKRAEILEFVARNDCLNSFRFPPGHISIISSAAASQLSHCSQKSPQQQRKENQALSLALQPQRRSFINFAASPQKFDNCINRYRRAV